MDKDIREKIAHDLERRFHHVQNRKNDKEHVLNKTLDRIERFLRSNLMQAGWHDMRIQDMIVLVVDNFYEAVMNHMFKFDPKSKAYEWMDMSESELKIQRLELDHAEGRLNHNEYIEIVSNIKNEKSSEEDLKVA